VTELVSLLSHERQKQTHRSPRQIHPERCVYSIVQIIHRDLGLNFSFTNALVTYFIVYSYLVR